MSTFKDFHSALNPQCLSCNQPAMPLSFQVHASSLYREVRSQVQFFPSRVEGGDIYNKLSPGKLCTLFRRISTHFARRMCHIHGGDHTRAHTHTHTRTHVRSDTLPNKTHTGGKWQSVWKALLPSLEPSSKAAAAFLGTRSAAPQSRCRVRPMFAHAEWGRATTSVSKLHLFRVLSSL